MGVTPRRNWANRRLTKHAETRARPTFPQLDDNRRLAASVLLSTAFQIRFHPAQQQIRDLIYAGALDEIRQARADKSVCAVRRRLLGLLGAVACPQ